MPRSLAACPRDDGVVVVAEHGLDLLHLLREPAGFLADRRAGGLGRVAGAAGRFAGLVQGDVPALAGRRVPGPAHPPVRLPVSPSHRRREDLAGRVAGPRAGQRARREPVERGQQRGVPRRVEGLEQFGPGGGPPGREVALHPGLDRPDQELDRHEAAGSPAGGPGAPRRRAPRRAGRRATSARPPVVRLSERGMTWPNDRRVARSLRVVTRIWCTASNSSARTIGSSDFSALRLQRAGRPSTTSPADDERRGWVPAMGPVAMIAPPGSGR